MKTLQDYLFVSLLVLPVGWASSCPARAETDGWVRIETTGGVPGQDVRVEIYVDVMGPVECFSLDFGFNLEVLEYREILRGRAFSPEDRLVLGVGMDALFPDSPEHRSASVVTPQDVFFPLGDDIHVATIVFRVRWNVMPGETAFLVRRADASGEDQRTAPAIKYSRTTSYSPPLCASIPLLPRTGPPPPSSVTCTQDFRSIRVAWQNSGIYDGIRITRNCEWMADVEGGTTSWVDIEPPTGELTYRVASLLGDRSSYGVKCLVSHEGPALPPPVELRSEDLGTSVRLTWNSPVPYDEILVFRNQTFLAGLPGDAADCEDSSPPADVSIYAVAGVREGIESEATVSMVRSAYPYRYRIPEIVVEPGMRNVRVPLMATIRDATGALQFSVHIDTDILEPVAIELRESLFRSWGQFLTRGDVHLLKDAGANFVRAVVFWGPNKIPPLYEEAVAWLIFNVPEDVVPGTRTKMHFQDSDHSPGAPVENSVCRNEASPYEKPQIVGIPVEVLIDGEVLVALPQGLPGMIPARVDCSGLEGGGVLVQWLLSEAADEIVLERDGEIIAVLDGTQSSYQDRSAGHGPHAYRVIARRGASEFPGTCTIFTGVPGRFLRGDVDGDGRFSLADVLAIILFAFADEEGKLPCLDAADVNDSGRIDVEDALNLLARIFDRGGQTVSPAWVHDRTPDGLGCGEPGDPR